MRLRISTKAIRHMEYMLVDVAIVLLAYIVTIVSFAVYASINYTASFLFVFFIAVVNVFTLNVYGIYQRIWARTSGHGITIILNAVVVATLLVVLIIVLFEYHPLPIRFVLFGNLLCLFGFIGIRYRSRLATSFLWRWRAAFRGEFPKQQPQVRVLIVGAGESGQTLAWRLMHRLNNGKSSKHQVVGFIDDDLEKQNMFVEGCRVVGTRKDIERLTEALSVDLIVLTVHNISGADFREILTSCENTKALIKVVPDLEALVNAKSAPAALRDVQPEDFIGRTMITRHEDVDLTPVMNKVVLITGAAGSIGSELSRQIMQYNPKKAILLDNNESGLHDLTTELRTKYPDADIVPALADITICSSLGALFAAFFPEIVFHAAAYKHVPMLEYYPREAIRVNITGTRNVASLTKEYGAERFVLISSDKAVNPTNVMGATKRACELLLHAFSESPDNRTHFVSVRFGNVLGSRGSVVPTFNQQIDNGGPITVTDPEMTRYFMSIPEAVNLVIHAACMTEGNEIFILQMGEVVHILELAERMIRMRGLRPYKDIEIQFTGVRPGEKLHEELFHGDEKPSETIHPHIMQVNQRNKPVDWKVFSDKLDRLERDVSENERDVLDKLLQIIA